MLGGHMMQAEYIRHHSIYLNEINDLAVRKKYYSRNLKKQNKNKDNKYIKTRESSSLVLCEGHIVNTASHNSMKL